jgi:hypothetical protein
MPPPVELPPRPETVLPSSQTPIPHRLSPLARGRGGRR